MNKTQLKNLEKKIKVVEKERAASPGKIMGKCESCESFTVLVEEVGLCGPCCFGEADTIMGNW